MDLHNHGYGPKLLLVTVALLLAAETAHANRTVTTSSGCTNVNVRHNSKTTRMSKIRPRQVVTNKKLSLIKELQKQEPSLLVELERND
jgi:hypothetical protein